MKQEKLNKEEQYFNEKLNQLNFEYDPADWNALEKQLPKGKGSWFSANKMLVAAATTLLIVAAVSYNNSEKTEVAKNEPTEKVQTPAIIKEKKGLSSNEDLDSPESENEVESKEVENAEIKEPTSTEKSIAQQSNHDPIQQPKAERATQAKAEESTDLKVEPSEASKTVEKRNFNLQLPAKICSNEIQKLMMETAELIPDDYIMGWKFEEEAPMFLRARIEDKHGNVVQSFDNRVEVIDVSNYETNFTYTDKIDPYNDLQVELKAEESTYSSFDWVNDEGKLIGSGSIFNYTVKTQGIYDLELIAKTQEGCAVSTQKPVSVQNDFDPLAPTAFSPDNDGINDEFIPVGFKGRDDQFKMEIFNLNGEMVYRGTDNEKGWNGQLNNGGQALPQGTYFWKVSISNNKGQHRSFAGNVKLLRNL